MNVLKKYKVMARKAKKESHLARLVKSLGTIGTAKTPLSALYRKKETPGAPGSPKVRGKGTKASSKVGRPSRALAPEAPAAPARPRPINMNRYRSYSRSGWDTRHPSYRLESAQYASDLAAFNAASATHFEALDLIISTNRKRKAQKAAYRTRLSKWLTGRGRGNSLGNGSRGSSSSKGSR